MLGAWWMAVGAGGVGVVLGWTAALVTRAGPPRGILGALCGLVGVLGAAFVLMLAGGASHEHAAWMAGGSVASWLVGYVGHRACLEHVKRRGARVRRAAGEV